MRFAPQARSLILLPLMQLIPDIAFWNNARSLYQKVSDIRA
jgi:hypothetical protein